MPFTVEYVMKRPNKEVDFPKNVDEAEKLSELREEYSVSSEVFFSDDELIKSVRHTTDTVSEYSAFYEQAQLLWEKEKISDKCASSNIELTMEVVTNT